MYYYIQTNTEIMKTNHNLSIFYFTNIQEAQCTKSCLGRVSRPSQRSGLSSNYSPVPSPTLSPHTWFPVVPYSPWLWSEPVGGWEGPRSGALCPLPSPNNAPPHPASIHPAPHGSPFTMRLEPASRERDQGVVNAPHSNWSSGCSNGYAIMVTGFLLYRIHVSSL